MKKAIIGIILFSLILISFVSAFSISPVKLHSWQQAQITCTFSYEPVCCIFPYEVITFGNAGCCIANDGFPLYNGECNSKINNIFNFRIKQIQIYLIK